MFTEGDKMVDMHGDKLDRNCRRNKAANVDY